MFRSFAVTIRPKGGLVPGSAYETKLLKYLNNGTGGMTHSVYGFEMKDEARHIHAQIFFDADHPKRKGDITKQLKRIAEKTDPDWSVASAKVLVGGVKVAYNDDFMDQYIAKDGEWALYNPPLSTEEYYPSKSEQEAVMARAQAKDYEMHHLKELWGDRELESEHPLLQLEQVADFVFDQMYVHKNIKTIADSRRRKQLVQNCYFYLYPNNSCHKEWMLNSGTLEEIRTLKKHLKLNSAIDL